MPVGPIRLGLIGAGRWGRIYIKTISRLEGFELTRLASSNPQSPSLVDKDCAVTPNWLDVAGADDLDGVVIATPPDLHADMARAAIEAGNPVLIEKPLTLDVDEAHNLLNVATRYDAIVHVDHIHLYHPAYRAMKSIGPGIGPIHAIRSEAGDWGPFRSDTPMLWDRGSHEVSLCLDLLGEKPEEVSAQIKESRETPDGPGEVISLHLTFPGNISADIDIGNLLETKRRFFAVHHARETLIYDDIGPDALVREPRPDEAKCISDKAEAVPVPDILPLDQVLLDFAAANKKGEGDLSGLRLGVDVIDVLDMCQKKLGR